MLDELRSLEERVGSRLRELRPLVDEYHELKRLAQRLGVDANVAPHGAAQRATTRPKRRNQTTPPSAPRARSRGSRTPGNDGRKGPSVQESQGEKIGQSPGEQVGQRASGTGRREQVVELVKARPGITVRQLGAELGVDPTSLYRIVHRLQSDGALKKEGRQLQPS